MSSGLAPAEEVARGVKDFSCHCTVRGVLVQQTSIWIGERIMKSWLLAVAFACFALPASSQAANVVFADSFDDGIVTDWSMSTNYSGATAVTVRSDYFVSPGFALYTYFDAPPGGSNIYVTASHDFFAPVVADYTLDLSAGSTYCDTCVISYEVYVDGVMRAQTSAPQAFEQRSFFLPALTAGVHVIGLGVSSNFAVFGRFNASFDDVVISTTAPVPEPETYALMLAGLGLLRLAVGRRSNTRGHSIRES